MKTSRQLGFRAFSKQFKDSLRLCLLSSVIVMSAVLPAKAVLEGDPELLRMTAMAQKDNRGRIDTWQGSSFCPQNGPFKKIKGTQNNLSLAGRDDMADSMLGKLHLVKSTNPVFATAAWLIPMPSRRSGVKWLPQPCVHSALPTGNTGLLRVSPIAEGIEA